MSIRNWPISPASPARCPNPEAAAPEVAADPRIPDVDRPVVAAAKAFATGSRTGRHAHGRAQLIFAVSGLMVATADTGTWVVPPGYALWMPPGLNHDVAMRGDVAMCTVYVAAHARPDLPPDCRVVAVTPLLAASLSALADEAPAYDTDGRGSLLAALILDEIVRAPATPFALPVPRDPRLARAARALIDQPGAGHDLDRWAGIAGVSRRTLTRGFKAETGLSFGAWRRRLRLIEAAGAEAEGEPIGRVCARLGYRSPAAFRAMARREFG